MLQVVAAPLSTSITCSKDCNKINSQAYFLASVNKGYTLFGLGYHITGSAISNHFKRSKTS